MLSGRAPSSLPVGCQVRVALRVLGPAEAAVDDQIVVLRSSRARALLAMLAAHRGQYVSPDRLAAAVWPVDPPADPAGALHNQISRLRATLGATTVRSGPAGYQLGDVALDVDAFESLLRRARDGGADRDDCRRLLAEAVALWRGPAFADLDDGAGAEAARLEELRKTAREELVVATTAVDPDAAVALARELVAEDELRERPRLLLARALSRQHATAEALGVLTEYRRVLAEELGIDPSPELVDLHAELLLATDHTPAPLPLVPPPRPLGAVLGREQDLEGLGEQLDRSRLVTVIGAGGVGKTTLAQAYAAEQGPAAYVDLTTARSTDDLGAAFARAFGIERQDESRWVDRLAEVLVRRELLVVVDNADAVAAEAAGFLTDLLARVPAARALVTSREPLGVRGERLWPLEPLPVDGPASLGAALFLDRAGAVAPRWSPDTTEMEQVVRLCQRLDGLPLALELAAAELRHRTVGEILDGLEQRSNLPGGPIRAALDASYDRLTPQEREVLERLTVFPQPFDAEAGHRACGGATTYREFRAVVDALVDKSLVHARPDGRTMAYSLLETVRDHGRQRLAASGRLEAVRTEHATMALDLALECEQRAFGPEEAEVARRLDAHRPDLVVAHDHLRTHGEDSKAASLAVAVHFHASIRGRADLLELAAGSVATMTGLAPDLAAEVAGAAADTAMLRGDHDAARALLTRASEAALDAADPVVAGRLAQGVAGDLALFHGRPEIAQQHYTRAAEGFARAGRPALAAWLTGARALAMGHDSAGEAARDLAQSALEAALETGCRSAIAICRYALAELEIGTAPTTAHRLLRDSIADADQVGASYVAGLARLSLATLSMRTGGTPEAVQLYRSLIASWLLAGNWTQQWNTLRTLVPALVDWGRSAAAVRLAAGIEVHAAAAAWGDDADQLSRAARDARAVLGDARYDAESATGRASDRGRVVADVQAVLDRLAAGE